MNLNTLPGLLHALRVSIQVVLEPQVLDRQAIERRSNQPSIVAAFGSLYSGIYRVIATSGGSRSQLEEEAREHFKDHAAIYTGTDTRGKYRFAKATEVLWSGDAAVAEVLQKPVVEPLCEHCCPFPAQ